MNYASLAAQPAPTPRVDLAPVLVIGSSEAARRSGTAEVQAAGMRLAAAVAVEDAVERIDQQPSASAVWIELDRDPGPSLDRLLERINLEADAGSYAAIVAVPKELLDAVAARVTSSRVELLIDENATGRAVALGIALAQLGINPRVREVAPDSSVARLRQLSEEVARLAATLSSTAGAATSSRNDRRAPVADNKPVPDISPETVEAVIRARRIRTRYFPEHLFADPAWDMLLDLTKAELAQIRVPVSSLCIAAAVPATTALRWIKTLTDTGLLVRRADPHDGRRVFIEMASATSQAMRRYFGDIGQVAGI